MPDARDIAAKRIVLIEDDERFGASLTRAIDSAPDLELQAHVGTVADGMALLAGQPADVMLVDLGLPDGSGIELIRATRLAWTSCQVMVLSVFGDETNVVSSIEAGAQAYLLKDYASPRVLEEIRSLCAGGSPISPRIARHILMRLASGTRPAPSPVATVPETTSTALSSREQQVLNYITKGFTYDEIAFKMDVSRHTVLTFVRRIYAKLEVNSKIEAINKARSQGMIQN